MYVDAKASEMRPHEVAIVWWSLPFLRSLPKDCLMPVVGTVNMRTRTFPFDALEEATCRAASDMLTQDLAVVWVSLSRTQPYLRPSEELINSLVEATRDVMSEMSGEDLLSTWGGITTLRGAMPFHLFQGLQDAKRMWASGQTLNEKR